MVSYQRYSHHARRALSHAARLASRYTHPHLDTGHLLVGVMMSEGSLGSKVLRELDLEAAVGEVYLKRLINPAAEGAAEVSPDPAYILTLELSAEEANWLGHHYVGTEHLLLGLTRSNVGTAAVILRLLEVNVEQIRRRVRSAFSDGLREFSLETVRRNARVSELSRRVLSAAEQMAVSLDHPEVGLGHLLLALFYEQRGITASILIQSGFDENRMKAAVDAKDPSLLVSIELLLDAAQNQAERLGSHYIGTDHLLLTLAQIPAGAALLQGYGVAPDKIRRLLSKHLRRD